MTLEELQKHKLFAKLATDAKKRFLVSYIASGFKIDEAVRAAYPRVANEDSIKTVGARLLRDAQIGTLLDLWHGEEPEPTDEEFRHYVWKAILENKNGAGKSALLSLYAELRGLRIKGKSPEQQTAEDDEILKDIQL